MRNVKRPWMGSGLVGQKSRDDSSHVRLEKEVRQEGNYFGKNDNRNQPKTLPRLMRAAVAYDSCVGREGGEGWQQRVQFR